ncbi:MAG: arginine--tRNA ligase [Rickettsiales bacterium]|jgi:arginyl-tRNA synthetase|nr:arginine--tRNA ligase [Rickettsiales bacterium]
MNIFYTIREVILETLENLVTEGALPGGLDTTAITAEPPRDASHGDIATNAAMVLAKPASKNPREIAELIAKKLKFHDAIEHVEIAGPGFINLRLKPSVWQSIMPVILEEKIGFGNSEIGAGKKVNVEFVSANPTGPMHIGHSRGAVFGDALARLMMKAGYDVTREYYINDAGAQVDTLAKSAYLRYREALGHNIGAIPEGYYPGEYLIPVGKALADTYGNTFLSQEESEWLPVIRRFAIDAMMAMIREDLLAMGVEHDIYSSEKALHERGAVDAALEYLEAKGLVYRGILEPPKGKTPEDWEPREQTLFRSSDFGDDVDRPLKKSDGSWTYFASDIAYHLDKYQRGFNHMILELGADHGGYLKRMKAAVKALSGGEATLEIKFHQLVNFLEGGVPAKMSKRAGTFVTVRDVMDKVGRDILRFIMLTRKNDVVLDFDFQKVQEQSRDNPVFYVQYAHARARSVLRHAVEDAPEAVQKLESLSTVALQKINDEDELQLLRLLASWPRTVELSAQHLEPHRITFYLQEVAASFHGLWNKGREHATLRFIIADDNELTAARLALVKAVSLVIASGLNVLGVNPVEEMH